MAQNWKQWVKYLHAGAGAVVCIDVVELAEDSTGWIHRQILSLFTRR